MRLSILWDYQTARNNLPSMSQTTRRCWMRPCPGVDTTTSRTAPGTVVDSRWFEARESMHRSWIPFVAVLSCSSDRRYYKHNDSQSLQLLKVIVYHEWHKLIAEHDALGILERTLDISPKNNMLSCLLVEPCGNSTLLEVSGSRKPCRCPGSAVGISTVVCRLRENVRIRIGGRRSGV